MRSHWDFGFKIGPEKTDIAWREKTSASNDLNINNKFKEDKFVSSAVVV